MWVTNERRKDPAKDVEVIATVGDNLLFRSSMDGHYGNARTHVPASQTCVFMLLPSGTDARL